MHMIYTVTLNPALDYVMEVPAFSKGAVNRTKGEAIYYGGKGINVSILLHRLGVENVALGFLAGFTGKEIEAGVKTHGVTTDFIFLKEGTSRINVKLKGQEREGETQVNAQGPNVDGASLEKLYAQLEQLQAGDYLVLAGSLAKGLSQELYKDMMQKVMGKQVQVVVDATGELLKNTLSCRPFLVKPNEEELGELFRTTLHTREDVVFYGHKLQELGARNVLVSMGKKGAILLTETGECYFMGITDGEVKNSVGAGDSMVAGMLAGYMKNQDWKAAFKLGTAAGGATACSEELATREEILQAWNGLEEPVVV